MNKILVLVMCWYLLFINSGCSALDPKPFDPYKPPNIKFEETAPYELAERIKMPTKPALIYLDANYKVTKDKKQVKYFAMTHKEWKKIEALLIGFKARGKVINEQANLVNIHIAEINELKKLIALKEASRDEYIALLVNAENAYRSEKAYHMLDNFINKTIIVLLGAGLVLIAL